MSKFEILQNNKIVHEIKKYREFGKKILTYRYQESKALIVAFDTQRLLLDILRVGGWLRIGNQIVQWTLTIGDFALFRTLMKVISDSVEKLNTYLIDFYQQFIYIEKLRTQFDDIAVIPKLTTGKELQVTTGEIACNSITFAYPDGEAIVEDFTCVFQGWKKAALVGSSGSGKSTLVKLLIGYLHLTWGSISIDWQKLDDIALMSYYKHIGYLTQEPNVFDGTIRENMLYGLSAEAFEEDVAVINEKLDAALRMAKCDFVYELLEGVDTEIGEKWIRLSGWQRQRLAIAKIFLKDPKIIILDEPTSALDSFSEEAITEAMHNLFEGRTVIIIAHRLQTVKAADEILVLDKQPGEGAQVIERGTHEELVKQWWYYARMLEVQTGF